LFYPPKNVYGDRFGPPEGEMNRDTREKVFDSSNKPGGAANVIKEAKEEFVVNRVESLGEIQQQQVSFLLLVDGFVIQLGEVIDIIVNAPVRGKTFLLKEKPVGRDFFENLLENRSDDTVVRVGNGDRPSLVGFGSVLRLWILVPRESATRRRTGATRSATVDQALKGMPSGPGVEVRVLFMARRTCCSVGSRGDLLRRRG
jgi:hypothetical protein